jgi:peptide/nickel transport system substrate-binding protein
MKRAAALVCAAVFCLCPSSAERAAAAGAALHELTFADGSDVQKLNPLLITTYEENYTAQLTGAFLTRLGPDRKPVAELAREVPSQRNGGVSADGKTIVYHLRPNLRWSDGSPLTAADVVFTARCIIAKDTPVASTSGWDQIVSVSSPRPGDVRFQLKAPYSPAFYTYFASYNGYAILPERLLRGVDLRTAPFNQLPVGAGPFRYASFRRGDRVIMEANPYYYRGRPKLDRLVFKFVPDENTVTTQVLTGEIDLALSVQPTQLARLEGAPGVTLLERPSGRTGYIGFLTTKPPLDDPRVRLALRDGLDRREILQKIYRGHGSIWDDPVTPLDPFFGGGVRAADPDLGRAAALLDSAGWRAGPDGLRRRNGVPLTLDFVDQTGNDIGLHIVELARAQWAKLGVTVSARTVNGDVVFALDGLAAHGDYGALVYGAFTISTDIEQTYACKGRPPHGFNYSRYCNPKVDAALARANATYDDALRQRLYLQARRMLAADVPDIPTIHREDIFALRPAVRGFHPNGLTMFDDVSNLDVQR